MKGDLQAIKEKTTPGTRLLTARGMEEVSSQHTSNENILGLDTHSVTGSPRHIDLVWDETRLEGNTIVSDNIPPIEIQGKRE